MHEAIVIRDAQSGAQASIAPDLGFNCFSFLPVLEGKPREVLDSPPDVLSGEHRASSFGIPLLFPFPNRIDHGKFQWDEHEWNLPLSPGKPHAIHGFCLDRAWEVVDQTEQSVTGRFQLSKNSPDRRRLWPADYILEVRYRVAENRLETQFRISNPDNKPLPWGLGTHPYFRVPLSDTSEPRHAIFSAPVERQWELKESIPTGRQFPVEPTGSLRTGIAFGATHFDDVFTGWESGGGTVTCSLIDESAGIDLTQVCDAALFRELVIYTPPERNAVCLEPYTCVTNAINLQSEDNDAGLQRLAPGDSVQTWLAIQAGPLLV